MGYVEDNLLKDESVVYRTTLHWSIFFWPALLLILAVLIAIMGTDTMGTATMFVIVATVWGISAFIVYASSEFAVTNKRVLIKTGLVSRKSIETQLAKVEGIQVDQGLAGRILNYGTIRVTGTGGTSSPFKRISAPIEFRKHVQGQL